MTEYGIKAFAWGWFSGVAFSSMMFLIVAWAS